MNLRQHRRARNRMAHSRAHIPAYTRFVVTSSVIERLRAAWSPAEELARCLQERSVK